MADRDKKKVIWVDKDKWYSENMRNTSHSQIESYSSCSVKWALQKVFRVKEEWSDNMSFGNVYHSCVEALLRGGKSTPDKLMTRIAKVWQESFATEFKNHNLDEKEFAAIKAMSDSSVSVLIDYFCKKGYDIVKVKDEEGNLIPAIELGLSVPILNPITKQYRDDYYFLMYIDAIVIDKDGKVIILDHKTAGRRYSDKKIQMNNQLPLYAYGVQELFRQNNIKYDNWTGYDVLLKQKTVAIEPYEKQVKYSDIERMLMATHMALEGMKKRSFCPTNSEMVCGSFCSFYKICFEGDNSQVDYKKIIQYMGEANDQEIDISGGIEDEPDMLDW